MSKPDNKTTWATDPSALKVPVSAARQDLGWLQVGNTGERPTLQELNGWMGGIGSHIDWIGDEAKDTLGEALIFTDQWEWDTSRVKDSNTDDPMNTRISSTVLNLNGLSFSINVGGPVTSDDWIDYKLDCYQGARQWEFIDMMNKGLAIRIVDGADVEWTIFTLFEASSANVSLSSSASSGGFCSFTIKDPATSQNEITRILPDGTESFPTTFDEFVQLDSEALFDQKNPNGIRVGTQGSDTAVLSNEGLNERVMLGTPLRKKWIRPYVISKAINTVSIPETSGFPLALRAGGRYGFEINIAMSNATFLDGTMSMYAHESSQTDKILEWQVNGTNHRSRITKGEFNFLGNEATAGITLRVDSQFERPFGASNVLDTLYGPDNFFYNYMTIEELY